MSPAMENTGELNGLIKHPTTLVTNGAVDIRGRTADKTKTGGWRAASIIIVNEFVERMAFFAISVNMVAYLTNAMHQALPDAATHMTDWIGASYTLTILGAFCADAYLGRFCTIIIFTCIYAVGMVMLTLSASIDSLRPPPCVGMVCLPATAHQSGFLFAALGLIAVGTGGIKPCVSTLGADQFDEADEQEGQKKYSFFNWFFVAITMGVMLGITFIVYVEEKKGYGWGFGIPTALTGVSVVVLAIGSPFYRYQRPKGSALTRFAQVASAAFRNHMKGVKVEEGVELYEVNTKESDIVGARKLSNTPQLRFFDKAAVTTEEGIITNRWRLCTVTQVEEFKSFVRVLPIWATTIALYITFVQMNSLFLSQAALTNRRLSKHFVIPPGSVPVFAVFNSIILIPLDEYVLIPILRRFTGHRRGMSSLQRISVGLFISILAAASAALVERRRRHDANTGTHTSVFWLFPQFFLVGAMEVFAYVGQLQFFYDEATDGTRSLSSAIFLSEIGIGGWLSSAIVKIIVRATGGKEKGWIRNNLNHSKLDYFYWILFGINVLNLLAYLVAAKLYKGRDDADQGQGAEQDHTTC